MSVHPSVLKYGDPILRCDTAPVEVFDGYLRSLVGNMARIMVESEGMGLAAPQVGILSQLLVYRMSDQPDTPAAVLVNPRWKAADEQVSWGMEGCLSLPGVQLMVPRFQVIEVEAQDLDGEPVAFQAEDLEARVIQHETDHLHGRLILDHVEAEQRYAALRRLAVTLREPQVVRPSTADISEQMQALRQALASGAGLEG